MALMRYEPVGLNQLQQQINRLFTGWDDTDSSAATAGWVPTVDINEYDDRFQLFVDIPGVDPDAVEITLDNGVLTISGERGARSDRDGNAVQRRVERGAGQFHRRFILPDTVDAEKVAASNRHGVLEISIPKQAKALPRRIKVAA
ncbi:MAG: Hsp20/alpha crystallin family protein [Pseudomonadales bacterium]|nr:Hsp20/alpha crystallin family protein [Pseudomonadales bacterium]